MNQKNTMHNDRPGNRRQSYEFNVKNQRKRSDGRILLDIKTEVDGEVLEFTPPAFTAQQIRTGRFKKHVCRLIDEKLGDTPDAPDLTGKKIQTGGNDKTPPQPPK